MVWFVGRQFGDVVWWDNMRIKWEGRNGTDSGGGAVMEDCERTHARGTACAADETLGGITTGVGSGPKARLVLQTMLNGKIFVFCFVVDDCTNSASRGIVIHICNQPDRQITKNIDEII
jgi:hypothetical protein